MAGAATLVYMFLFNDMLMLTDKRKSFSGEEQYFFKEQIDLTGMFVAEMGSSQKGFVLKTKYGIVEQFFAENVEKRVLWVKHLENATTELGKKRATIMPVSTSSSGGIPVYVEDTSSTSNADKEPTKEISQEKEEADKTTAAKDKEVKPTKEPPPPPKLEAPSMYYLLLFLYIPHHTNIILFRIHHAKKFSVRGDGDARVIRGSPRATKGVIPKAA